MKWPWVARWKYEVNKSFADSWFREWRKVCMHVLDLQDEIRQLKQPSDKAGRFTRRKL